MSRRRDPVLVLIALFRLAKAVVLLALSVAVLELISPGSAAAAQRWLESFPYAEGHEEVGAFARKALASSASQKQVVALVAFAYGALFAVEGVGLLRQKSWAELLTIVATASFIPFEIYEVWKRPELLRGSVLVVNVAIVIYLVWKRRRRQRVGATVAA